MSKNVFTASATIKYLKSREKITIKQMALILDVHAKVVQEIENGKVNFTKRHYFSIIEAFPYMEGAIEYYENLKLKDK